jgi:predicted dehydrogenase
MDWLVLGAGSIGRRHAKNIRQLFPDDRLTVYDPLEENLNKLKGDRSVDLIHMEQQVLARNPDVCLICSPNHLHLQQAMYWANRGAHLFIEKPLSHTMDGIQELIALLDQTKRIAMVACNMRFFPNIIHVKSLLDNHAVGTIYGIQVETGSYMPDWRPYSDYRENYGAKKKTGGGVMLDNIHEVDLIRWYGGEVTSVVALADHVSNLEIETEDLAAILCRFKQGAIGEIHLDYLQRPYSRACKIIGQQGTIIWDIKEGVTKIHTENHTEWEEVYRLPAGYDFNAMYMEELKAFHAILTEGKPVINPPEEAQQTLQIVLAAKRSIHERIHVTL